MRLAKIMSFETFAAQAGASRQDIGDAGLHRSSYHISRRSWQRMVEEQAARDRELISRRGALRAEYDAMVASGEFTEPTSDDRLREVAQDESERAAAARRILAKKEANRARAADA